MGNTPTGSPSVILSPIAQCWKVYVIEVKFYRRKKFFSDICTNINWMCGEGWAICRWYSIWAFLGRELSLGKFGKR